MLTMYLTIFAESFPEWFHQFARRLETDPAYAAEFHASVKAIPRAAWERTAKWKQIAKLKHMTRPWCEQCGARHKKREVHHLTDEHIGIELLYFEQDLIVLCEDCHESRHAQLRLTLAPQAQSPDLYELMQRNP